jgi:hypothetical protein
MSKVYDAFGSVPATIPPSRPVRYWDRALLAAGGTLALTYPTLLALAWSIPGGQLVRFPMALKGGALGLFHVMTAGISFRAPAREFFAIAATHDQTLPRIAIVCGLSLLAAGWVLKRGLVPVKNEWHTKGPRLLEGKEAIEEARRRSVPVKERQVDPYHLALHPDLVLSKRQWSRHAWIYGSVGAGKTVILLPFIEQIIARDDKLFLYDVKGDMTSKFRRPIIVSPFDTRSYVWDIAADIRTPSQAAAFAASLIPEAEGNGKFWSVGAQQLVTGALRALQNTRGTDWGWPHLAHAVAQGAPDMLPMIREHYAKASPLIENTESQTTASLLATLAGFTRVIDDLALAWPKVGKRRFAITEWIGDDYNGRKQVIVQAGPDAQLTRAYIAAMLNVAVPSIISSQLSDNEQGRFLGFVLDELPSLGHIQLAPLIDKGRSKGVVVVAAVQDLAQLRKVYGPDEAQSLTSMVGMHVICQVQMGETRDKLAQQLGRHKVAWRTHDDKSTLHEDSRPLISGGELTDRLGFRKHRRMGPEKWGIRAIVQMGGDPLLLDFPGKSYPEVRRGQVPAAWTKGPAGGSPAPHASSPTQAQKDQTRQVLGMSREELQAEMASLYDQQPGR